jgi:hypothetical protein
VTLLLDKMALEQAVLAEFLPFSLANDHSTIEPHSSVTAPEM